MDSCESFRRPLCFHRPAEIKGLSLSLVYTSRSETGKIPIEGSVRCMATECPLVEDRRRLYQFH